MHIAVCTIYQFNMAFQSPQFQTTMINVCGSFSLSDNVGNICVCRGSNSPDSLTDPPQPPFIVLQRKVWTFLTCHWKTFSVKNVFTLLYIVQDSTIYLNKKCVCPFHLLLQMINVICNLIREGVQKMCQSSNFVQTRGGHSLQTKSPIKIFLYFNSCIFLWRKCGKEP